MNRDYRNRPPVTTERRTPLGVILAAPVKVVAVAFSLGLAIPLAAFGACVALGLVFR